MDLCIAQGFIAKHNKHMTEKINLQAANDNLQKLFQYE